MYQTEKKYGVRWMLVPDIKILFRQDAWDILALENSCIIPMCISPKYIKFSQEGILFRRGFSYSPQHSLG